MTSRIGSFFNKLSDELDDIANRVEEGLSILLSGGGATTGGRSRSGIDNNENGETAMLDDIDVGADEEMMESPLNGIAKGVLGDIFEGSTGPQTPVEHIQAFRAAITWSEPFVIYLLCFQAAMLLATIWVSRMSSLTPRFMLMFIIWIIVNQAERFNTYGSEHWKDFATQNYFDRNGIFVGIMVCAPLIMDCIIMLLCLIKEASHLLVEVKREEVKRKRAKEATSKKKGGDKTEQKDAPSSSSTKSKNTKAD